MRLIQHCPMLLTLVFCVPATDAGATTFRVPSEYSTIRDAILASGTGDTILVAPGGYGGEGFRSLDLDRRWLISEAGSAATSIDCEGSEVDPHRFASFFTGAGGIEGFTVRRGWAYGLPGTEFPGQGGGVLAWGAAGVKLNDMVFEECGPALTITGTSPQISNCVVRNCTGIGISLSVNGGSLEDCVIEGNDGGLFMVLSELFRIDRCRILGNASDRGAGLKTSEAHNITISNTLLAENVATSEGGAISLGPGAVVFDQCTITRNVAAHGGGVATFGTFETIRFENTILSGNCAAEGGDEVWSTSANDAFSFECSAVDPAGVEGPGSVDYITAPVTVPPLFCAPASCVEVPTDGGNYELQSNSPCLPENNECGVLIGAFDEGCGPTDVPDLPVVSGAEVRAFPNPTAAECRLWLRAESGKPLHAEVLDVAGRIVRTLTIPVSAGTRGSLDLSWDGRDDQQQRVGSGVFFARIETTAGEFVARIVLVE